MVCCKNHFKITLSYKNKLGFGLKLLKSLVGNGKPFLLQDNHKLIKIIRGKLNQCCYCNRCSLSNIIIACIDYQPYWIKSLSPLTATAFVFLPSNHLSYCHSYNHYCHYSHFHHHYYWLLSIKWIAFFLKRKGFRKNLWGKIHKWKDFLHRNDEWFSGINWEIENSLFAVSFKQFF